MDKAIANLNKQISSEKRGGYGRLDYDFDELDLNEEQRLFVIEYVKHKYNNSTNNVMVWREETEGKKAYHNKQGCEIGDGVSFQFE